METKSPFFACPEFVEGVECNHMRNLILIGIIILVAIVGVVYWRYYKSPAVSITNFEECAAQGYPILESYPRQCKTPQGQTFTEDIGNELEKQNLIRVSSPRPNESIKSPLLIKGEARGFWFFEATFPIKLLDEKGNIIAQHYAQAKGEWMTEDFVPFEAELNFAVSKSQKGTLILEKDNPSDLPENYDELRIPVILQETGRTIKLYYYNPELDKDESGNISCSRQGLVPVERKIPISQTPIQDAIKLLL